MKTITEIVNELKIDRIHPGSAFIEKDCIGYFSGSAKDFTTVLGEYWGLEVKHDV